MQQGTDARSEAGAAPSTALHGESYVVVIRAWSGFYFGNGDPLPTMRRARLRTAEDLLQELDERLDEPLSWERKRHLVELLVDRICITSVTHDGKTRPVAEVAYTFTPITTRTGIGS
jgi:hypothetical protein